MVAIADKEASTTTRPIRSAFINSLAFFQSIQVALPPGRGKTGRAYPCIDPKRRFFKGIFVSAETAIRAGPNDPSVGIDQSAKRVAQPVNSKAGSAARNFLAGARQTEQEAVV